MLHLLPIIKLIADLVGTSVTVVLTAHEVVKLVKPATAKQSAPVEPKAQVSQLPKRDQNGKAGYRLRCARG